MPDNPLHYGCYLPSFTDKCFACGKCEKACPQHLPIRTALAQLQTELDNL